MEQPVGRVPWRGPCRAGRCRGSHGLRWLPVLARPLGAWTKAVRPGSTGG